MGAQILCAIAASILDRLFERGSRNPLGRVFAVRPFPTRQKPKGTREAFAQSSGNEEFDEYPVDTEDFASVLLRFENGMKGSFSVSQVSAGHKNGLEIEVDGGKAALAWKQERMTISSSRLRLRNS